MERVATCRNQSNVLLLGVQHHLRDQSDDLLPRYAGRLASRPRSAGRLIAPVRRRPLQLLAFSIFHIFGIPEYLMAGLADCIKGPAELSNCCHISPVVSLVVAVKSRAVRRQTQQAGRS